MGNFKRAPVNAGAMALLAFLLAAGCAQMPDYDPETAMRDLATACARSVCRTESKEITLRAANNNVAVYNTQLLPYADDGTVAIYPGERFAVRMKIQGGKLGQPVFEKLVDKMPEFGRGRDSDADAKGAPDTTTMPLEALLYLEFRQDDDGERMTLQLQSEFPVAIKYDAIMMMVTPQGPRPSRTSSCPLFPGAGGIETWPQALSMMLLTNIRVLDISGNVACQ